jgi:hypothetical protein
MGPLSDEGAPSRVPKDHGAARVEIPSFVGRKPSRKVTVSPERCATILGTLQEIGRASADMDGCAQLLEQVADELDAEQGVLILCNPLTERLEFVVHNQDPAFPKLYGDYFSGLDPTGLPDYIQGRSSLPQASPTVAVFDVKDVVDYGTLISSEFYNDFWRSGGVHYDLVDGVGERALRATDRRTEGRHRLRLPRASALLQRHRSGSLPESHPNRLGRPGDRGGVAGRWRRVFRGLRAQ